MSLKSVALNLRVTASHASEGSVRLTEEGAAGAGRPAAGLRCFSEEAASRPWTCSVRNFSPSTASAINCSQES